MSEKRSVIPAEAVEAAVDAMLASKLGDHPGINGEEFVEAARLALEAAAPYMMADVKLERKRELFARLRREILAARLKVTLDKELGRDTTSKQKALAGMKLPPIR